MNAENVLLGLGSFFGGTAGSLILARWLFSHLLHRDLEKYKAELQLKNELEMERLRSELRVAAHERETVFSRLHDRQAGVVAELYKLLIEARAAFTEFMRVLRLDDGSTEEERAHRAQDAFAAFQEYFRTHAIFLDESLCEKIDGALRLLWDKGMEFAAHAQLRERSFHRDLGDGQFKAWKELDTRLPEIQKDIEERFRTLLGVKDPQ